MYGGPVGFTGYREPVPVSLWAVKGEDNLGEARKAACKQRLKIDTQNWDITEGKTMYHKHSATVHALNDLCKTDIRESFTYTNGKENFGDAVKDITDAMMFSVRENFPLQFNTSLYEDSRRLALRQLYGRLLSKPEQHTYMVGEFPGKILKTFNDVLNNDPRGVKMFGYHGHRELLYALAKFFDISFEFDMAGFQEHGIPSATTLFFELHDLNSTEAKTNDLSDAGMYVRLVVYAPCKKLTDLEKGPAEVFCKGIGYRFGFHPHSDFVPYDTFVGHITNTIKRTGSYVDLCINQDLHAKQSTPHSKTAAAAAPSAESVSVMKKVFTIGVYVLVPLILVALGILVSPYIRRCGYTSV